LGTVIAKTTSIGRTHLQQADKVLVAGGNIREQQLQGKRGASRKTKKKMREDPDWLSVVKGGVELTQTPSQKRGGGVVAKRKGQEGGGSHGGKTENDRVVVDTSGAGYGGVFRDGGEGKTVGAE